MVRLRNKNITIKREKYIEKARRNKLVYHDFL